MTRAAAYAYEFVEFIPNELNDDTLYLSTEYATAVHNCMCGCGCKVITPLSPRYWKIIFDGVTVSLKRSVGNWGLPCQSHYWLREGHVEWARRWTPAEIEMNRELDPQNQPRYDLDLVETAREIPRGDGGGRMQRLWRTLGLR